MRGSARVRRAREALDALGRALAALPERALDQHRPDQRLGWLYEQIAQLDHIDRSLTLLLLDGFSYRDMAATLGITENNVGVKINRIKAHLTRLSQEGTHHGL